MDNAIPAIFKEIPWETRNIGIPSYAVDVEKSIGINGNTVDSALNMLRQNHRGSKFFIQARIPKDRLHDVALLSSRGFYYVETTLEPHARLDRLDSLEKFERDPASILPARFDVATINVNTSFFPHTGFENDIRHIAEKSFADDRFHLDWNCTKEIADRRFVHWVDDLMADPNAAFDMLTLNGENAGLMARKAGHLILAGFPPSYARSGLGEFLWLSSLKRIRDAKIYEVDTLISVNNASVLNLHARIGFRFRSPSVTLHYWSDANL